MSAIPRSARRLLLLALLAAIAWPTALYFDRSATWEAVHAFFLDRLFWLRGPADPGDRVVIVPVSEDSFEYLGKFWPLSYESLARAIENIKADGAVCVGLDFIVSDPYAGTVGDGDRLLRDALESPPRAVCAAKVETFRRRERLAGLDIDNSYAKIFAPNAFYGGAYVTGMIHADADRDGVIRRFRPLYVSAATRELTLVAACALKAQGFVDEGLIGRIDLSTPGYARLGSIEVPLDRIGRFLINYGGPTGRMRQVPFYAAADRLFPPGTFKGKVVLVGPAHKESHDFFLTPFNCSPADLTGDPMPGVEVMAAALDTILRGRTIAPAGSGATVTLAVIAATLEAAAALLTGPFAALAIFAVLAALTLGLSTHAFLARLLFLSPWPALATLVVTTGLALALRARVLESDTRLIRSLFSRFVANTVVDAVVREGLAFPLEGRTLDVCVVFGDIRGFTELAHRSTPDQLFRDLNEVFDIIVDEVFRSGGTLDKFIGDAVMIVYGAPVPMPDREIRALDTLLTIRRRLRELNFARAAAGRPELRMGFGISTGPAMCGNVGSARRLEYTAIGDTVNIASRLQGKAAGYEIVMTEEVYRRVGDRFGTPRRLDYELKGLEGKTGAYVLTDGPEIKGRGDASPRKL